jgi:hypothetical protein
MLSGRAAQKAKAAVIKLTNGWKSHFLAHPYGNPVGVRSVGLAQELPTQNDTFGFLCEFMLGAPPHARIRREIRMYHSGSLVLEKVRPFFGYRTTLRNAPENGISTPTAKRQPTTRASLDGIALDPSQYASANRHRTQPLSQQPMDTAQRTYCSDKECCAQVLHQLLS